MYNIYAVIFYWSSDKRARFVEATFPGANHMSATSKSGYPPRGPRSNSTLVGTAMLVRSKNCSVSEKHPHNAISILQTF